MNMIKGEDGLRSFRAIDVSTTEAGKQIAAALQNLFPGRKLGYLLFVDAQADGTVLDVEGAGWEDFDPATDWPTLRDVSFEDVRETTEHHLRGSSIKVVCRIMANGQKRCVKKRS